MKNNKFVQKLNTYRKKEKETKKLKKNTQLKKLKQNTMTEMMIKRMNNVMQRSVVVCCLKSIVQKQMKA